MLDKKRFYCILVILREQITRRRNAGEKNMKAITVITKSQFGNDSTDEYAVNEKCEGLWKNEKQILGTCQFYASTPAQFMRKIRAMINDYETVKMVRGSAKGF